MSTQTSSLPGLAPGCSNPVIAGYYADPSLVQFEGKFFVYATLDPWGGDTLGCWESDDFRCWTYRFLNWPTTEACRSALSNTNKIWAPSVVHGADGRFYMYVSVGSEIWAGVADHPLGPWRNLIGTRPLVRGDYQPGFHMIDAEAFIDDDGSAWLYWGSGLGWVNGRCYAVQLAPDMTSFVGEVRDVTPSNYFEAPFMVKRAGRYFLMYSEGRTDLDTYEVRYAVGDHPLGPFQEGPNSPILVTDAAANIFSPGHHAVFQLEGRDYIFYHRHCIPFESRTLDELEELEEPDDMKRQLCVDELRFTPDGRIENVRPTHEGPQLVQRALLSQDWARRATITASSQSGPLYGPERVLDGNYASRWQADDSDSGAWLQLDLGEVREVSRQEIRPEYAWKPLHFRCESSLDGARWQTLADFSSTPAIGSPIVVEGNAPARFLRLRFFHSNVSLFEWALF